MKIWKHNPLSIGFVGMTSTRLKEPWSITPMFQKADEAMKCLLELESLPQVAKSTFHGKINSKLQWRPQNVGTTKIINWILKKAKDKESSWFKKEATCRVQSRVGRDELTRLWKPRTFYHKPQILEVNHKVWYFPSGCLVLLWSIFFLALYLFFFLWNRKFILFVVLKNVICFALFLF